MPRREENRTGRPFALLDPSYPAWYIACVSLFFPKTFLRGAVAQLGARVNGIHEVAGSIPASSTIYPQRAGTVWLPPEFFPIFSIVL